MEPVPGAARSCLVVDDSAVVRKLARRLLEGHGFAVREAPDGAKALGAVREAMPDLVLLDWNMPVMDGLEFLGHARREFGPDHPVVMLCTTEASFERILEALTLGAQEYIMKPFDAAILRDKLALLGFVTDGSA
ncbi:response regulator [Roseomonas sp. OT10]|uniref:response regulator n=1 Tax=Roseomonas cutis TaxID=2897332 RepID=UPI001E608877|nr:response regulator [Roseomonas sp. OT10]UFN51137.1 response regulator [Roseomonas sp. OT10]